MSPGYYLSATLRAVFLLALAGIVYAYTTRLVTAQKADVQSVQPKKSAPGEQTGKKSASGAPAKAAAAALDVRHSLDGVPGPVLEMRDTILTAVRSGRIEDLTTAIEINEMKPAFGDAPAADPIAFLKNASADGEGREVLAALGNILDAPFAVVAAGSDIENNRIYVWPHFAEAGVKDLTPAQQVELLRLISQAAMTEMVAKGKYAYWSVGIGADGVWHFMRR